MCIWRMFVLCPCSDGVELYVIACCVAAVVKTIFLSISGNLVLVLKYVVCLCRGCDGCCIFYLNCEAWNCRFSIMGRGSVSSCMMLYVWVLCSLCGSPQCCVLYDLQFVNAGRGCNRHSPEPVS